MERLEGNRLAIGCASRLFTRLSRRKVTSTLWPECPGPHVARMSRPTTFHLESLMKDQGATLLWISLCSLQFVLADKGYDDEENPTGAYKAYCVPLQYNFELGLCQGISGNVNVCAVTAEGVHPLSAVSWLNREVMPKGAPHMDKTIIQGDKSYNDLQKYFHNWVCKQVDPLSLPIVSLSDPQRQSAACK